MKVVPHAMNFNWSRIVEQLLKVKQPSGKNQIKWGASEYSSGVFFYQIRVTHSAGSGAVDFRQVRKMLLLK